MESKEVLKLMFKDLEKILNQLNNVFRLKAYAVEYKGKKAKSYYRLRKEYKSESTIIDELSNIKDIFSELSFNLYNPKYESDYEKLSKDINEYMQNMYSIKEDQFNSKNNSIDTTEEVQAKEISSNQDVNYFKNKIIYSAGLNINTNNIIYIIEIRNVNKNIQENFRNEPSESFLKMVLDYFFYDYYETSNDVISINKKTLKYKYNEDYLNFLRRMIKGFIGKFEYYLKEGGQENKVIENKYFISDLFEEVENISNKTYEGENPFGSILFLSNDFLQSDSTDKIRYIIEFEDKNCIKLDESRRIRKLLEISNNEKELSLIADYNKILGIGEVDWNKITDEDCLYRIDFTGLSKYTLTKINTSINGYSEGSLTIEKSKKIFECSKRVEINEHNLTSTAFKNPRLNKEFSIEKFERIFKTQFGSDFGEENINKSLKVIGELVNQAKEQKHGTIVVITDRATVKSELSELEDQSTLIKSKQVKADYIKYLTAIDGAIYLDNKGTCYAIGVILDGIAEKGIGDPSRGARYNSAFKYYRKLKNEEKKSLIVVISEDGMINIVPDIGNEKNIRNIINEIIDLISASGEDKDIDIETLEKCEEKLNASRDDFDCNVYFDIGYEFFNKNKYEKAVEYYEKGIAKGEEEKSILTPDKYFIIGRSYYEIYTKNKKKQDWEKAFEYCNKVINFKNSQYRTTSFNDRGNLYYFAGMLKNYENEKNKFLKMSIEDYNEALMSNGDDKVILGNKSRAQFKMKQYKESISTAIRSLAYGKEYNSINDVIDGILSKRPELIEKSLDEYKILCKEIGIEPKEDVKKGIEKYL